MISLKRKTCGAKLPAVFMGEEEEILTSILPQELVIDVLLRLPAKSIGQLRCVSKPWRSFLSSLKFIKAHLTAHLHDQQKLLLISPSNNYSLFALTFERLKTHDTVPKKLDFCTRNSDEKWVSIVGSCNGLVLVGERHGRFLMNPTTMELVKLPSNPLAHDPWNEEFYFHTMDGFGYNSVTDDYRIVTLSYFSLFDLDDGPECEDTFVDVFSVKFGTWRRIDSSPYDHSQAETAPGVFLNGALHWLATSGTDESSVIAAFDLSSEKFKEVPPPAAIEKDQFVLNRLVVLGGCLGMVAELNDGASDLWMMKNYGLKDSWTKFILKAPDDYLYTPICLLGDVEVVCLVDEEEAVLEQDGELIVCNLTSGSFRGMVLDGVPYGSEDGAMAFSESLVPLSFYCRGEDQHSSEIKDSNLRQYKITKHYRSTTDGSCLS